MNAQGWFDDIATGQDGFLGGDGPDCIEGTLNNDEIYSGGGDDFVRTKDGADIVEGGRGNDTIEGGMGNDDLEGNGGADVLEGGTNEDCLKVGHESLSDVYDDVGSFDLDNYVAEPGVHDGVDVPNMNTSSTTEPSQPPHAECGPGPNGRHHGLAERRTHKRVSRVAGAAAGNNPCR